MKKLFAIPLFLLLIVLVHWFTNEVVGQTSSATYYVDCAGNDANNGISQTSAWRSIAKANAATLNPGDSLLFKRGCTWTNSSNGNYLTARWNGTAASRITVGAYGTGNTPIVQADARGTSRDQVMVNMTGSYITLENLKVNLLNPYRETSCRQADSTGVPLGWYVGFTVSGSNNILRSIEAERVAIAVNLPDNSTNNKIFNLYGHNLNAFWRISPTLNALGALGVNLHGNDHEVANSLFENNGAECNYVDASGNPTGQLTQNYSAPFELYNANRSYVHHNKAFGHRKHFEMGKLPDQVSADNVLAYNLFVSDKPDARGPNIHSADNQFGPILRTQAYHNTIVFTGAGSEAIIGSAGGTFRNNIFVAESKAAFYGSGTTESNNVYWDFQRTSDTNLDPCVQFAGSGCAALSTTNDVNPGFVNATVPTGNFHITSTSPAKDYGVAISSSNTLLNSILSTDLDGGSVPIGTNRDSGVYEFGTSTASPAASSLPVSSPSSTPQPAGATVTISPTQTSTNQFSLGITQVDGTGTAARTIIQNTTSFQNNHIMAWGVADPWPDPLTSGPTNWGGLDARMQLALDSGATPMITLMNAPWWMKGQLQSDGTTRLIPAERHPQNTSVSLDFENDPARRTLTASYTDYRGITYPSGYISADPYASRILDNQMDKWELLVRRVAERYMVAPYNVRYFQVWNELKGYYNPAINRWDHTTAAGDASGYNAKHGYTHMYNRVYNLLKQVAREKGIPESEIKVGGPYPVVASWSNTGAGGFPTNEPLLTNKSYGTWDQRDLDAVKYWLGTNSSGQRNRAGGEFVAVDLANRNKPEPGSTSPFSFKADPFTTNNKFSDMINWIRSLDNVAYPGAQTLPIVISEWYSTAYDTTDPALNNAIKTDAAVKIMKAAGNSPVIPLMWGGLESSSVHINQSLYRIVSGVAQGLPWSVTAQALKTHFPPGATLYEATSSSPNITAIASNVKVLVINKTNTSQAVTVEGVPVTLQSYEVKLLDRLVGPVATPPIVVPGDADGDQDADETDYQIWINHYGASTTSGVVDGDFNLNSKVDGVDYALWRKQVQASTSTPSPASSTSSPTLIGGAGTSSQTSPTPTPRASALPSSTTQILFPYVDAYVSQAAAGTNFGGAAALDVDGAPDAAISYVKFNLSSLPTNVTSARLTLKVINGSTATQSLYQVDPTSWQDTTITYNNRPALGSVIRTVTGTKTTGEMLEIDITSYVRANLGRNISIAIGQTDTSGISFNSRESQVPAEDKPRLLVTY